MDFFAPSSSSPNSHMTAAHHHQHQHYQQQQQHQLAWSQPHYYVSQQHHQQEQWDVDTPELLHYPSCASSPESVSARTPQATVLNHHQHNHHQQQHYHAQPDVTPYSSPYGSPSSSSSSTATATTIHTAAPQVVMYDDEEAWDAQTQAELEACLGPDFTMPEYSSAGRLSGPLLLTEPLSTHVSQQESRPRQQPSIGDHRTSPDMWQHQHQQQHQEPMMVFSAPTPTTTTASSLVPDFGCDPIYPSNIHPTTGYYPSKAIDMHMTPAYPSATYTNRHIHGLFPQFY